MKSKFLLSVSAVVLVASLTPGWADDFDQLISGVQQLEAKLPPEARIESKDVFTAADQAIKSRTDAANAQATAAADLATQQAVLAAAQSTYNNAQSSYQPQADVVAQKLDRLNYLSQTYSSQPLDAAKKQLNDATALMSAERYTWIPAATDAVNKTANLPDTDPRRKAAVDGLANANKVYAEAEFKALAASDIIKDPKNGLAKIQSAQQDYNDAKQKLDTLNTTKNGAGGTLQQINAQIAKDNATIATNKDAKTAAENTLKVIGLTGGLAKANDDFANYTAAQDKAKAAAAAKTAPTTPVLAGTGGSTPPVLAGTGTPAVGAPPVLVTTPVISNDGGSIITHDGGSIITHDGGSIITHDGGSIITHDGGSLLSEHGGGIVSEHGAGLTSTTASALVASLPAAALISNVVTSSNPFKRDSTISAFSNIDTSTPDQKWQKAVGNLSKTDQQALADLKTAIAKSPGMQLSQTQIDLVSKVTKSLDASTVQSLEQKATVATTVTSVKNAATVAVVNQAITEAKADPVVASAVLKVASGKAPTATETRRVNDVVAKAVDNLPISTGDKKAVHQRTREHVAVVVAPPPKVVATSAPVTPPLSTEVINQFITAGPAVIAVMQVQRDAALKAGNTTLATGLAADIVNVQSTIDQAKQQLAAAAAAPVQTTTKSEAIVTPASLTTETSSRTNTRSERDSDRSSNKNRGREPERSASTNREREPEQSRGRDFIPEHSPNMRREREHEREANTRREHEHEHERGREANTHHENERGREANKGHEGSGNRERGRSETARSSATYTAASASKTTATAPKAPPPPKAPPAPTLPPKH